MTYYMSKNNHLQTLYNSLCNIYEYEQIFGEDTKVFNQVRLLIYENIPCRLSYYNNSSNIVSSTDTKFNNYVKQNVKIFISNNIVIKPGSLIEVTKDKTTVLYKNSGKPAVYTNHQEIMITLLDDIG